MGMILIYGLLILLILTIIAVSIIFIFKRKHKTKIGLLISLPIFIIIIYCLFINNFDELLISKSDVRSDLKNANIILNEDFEILENSVVGFPERFQKTKLRISENDFARIISEIKNASDFKKSNESWLLHQASINNESPKNKVVIANYTLNGQFMREGYFRNGNYVPIYVIASFHSISNSKIIEYERIED